jgi:hypothetical protein
MELEGPVPSDPPRTQAFHKSGSPFKRLSGRIFLKKSPSPRRAAGSVLTGDPVIAHGRKPAVHGSPVAAWNPENKCALASRRRQFCPGAQGKENVMADEMTKITSGSLIAAEQVEGTSVYNLQDEKLGTVDDIMIDKVSGKAIYALMSFGGFLGIGEKYHPLPWSTLKYDEVKGGYIVNLDKRMLENAPTYDMMDEDFRWTPDYGRQVDKYYNVPTNWS